MTDLLDDYNGNYTMLEKPKEEEPHHPAFNSKQEEEWEMYESDYHDWKIKNENRY